MKNKFNFKIVGSGPTGLLLSIALSKFDCNIFLTDLLTKDRLINKDKTYAITHSTRKILSKFRLWEKLEPFLFGFDTLSISDSVTSAFTNLSTSDLDDDISSAENIGWVVKHSDLMNVFFQEIDNYENIFFITVIIFIIVYLLLTWFAKTSAKRISKIIRFIIILSSILLAFLMVYAGRYIFSLPFVLAILPLIKTKAGISLFQLLRLWGLFRVLRNSGRFNFNNFNQANTQQNMNLDEAYKILNLDPKKKYKKDEVLNSYKKIMKKIHPDVSPELSRLASIVNEAKETVIKNIV